MAEPGRAAGAGDLAVVIPTRDRWAVLTRTLDALAAQTATGFETVVVVDGADQRPPPLPAGVRAVQVDHGGPGAARNAGVEATTRPLVLFLGDDMVPAPTLVAHHLAAHERDPAPEVAVLGRVEWHPDVAGDRLARWLDWSGNQFDFRGITGDDAGWGRFYSCNVSLKRDFLRAAGGFDPAFEFDYEDLDLAYRLHGRGLRLRYAPHALAHHLHRYDWPALERRWASKARGERRMAAAHPWFTPFFRGRVEAALAAGRVAPFWPHLAHLAGTGGGAPGALARRKAERWYQRHLSLAFLDAWEGERDLEELRAYLGDRYDHARLVDHEGEVARECRAFGDEAAFYREGEAYLYDLTAFAMSGTKAPYRRDLQRHLAPGARVLDYGCGTGSDGLRLAAAGYRVAFADFDNPGLRFLRWRLSQRGLAAEVHDLDRGVPGGFDAAYAFDVIEHAPDPHAFLDELESRAALVAVNLLEPEPDERHPHRPLPVGDLLDRAARSGLVHYRRYHGRSHLVLYRPGQRSSAAARARLRAARRALPRRR